MQEYSITNKNSQWITGNIAKGCYEYTACKERRYVFETLVKAEMVAERFNGIVIYEA